jgi:hypothetical protein
MRLHALFVTITSVTVMVLVAGCGDSATEITGTLPVVGGITVDTLASRGDTIVVSWEPVSVSIEGYFLWGRIHVGDPWTLLEIAEENTAQHIADRAFYYTVMAFEGDNTSSATGIPDNSRADDIEQADVPLTGRPVGFVVDIAGDSLVHGDPSSPDFMQQFTIAADSMGERLYIYPGNAHPYTWPGGSRTRIAPAGSLVAPSPADSTMWRDSLDCGTSFFLALEDGHYCLLYSQDCSMDTLRLDGQLQPIINVRVFNQTW